MNKNDAMKIIDSMITSICQNPDQFQIHIKTVGQSIVSHGGIGQQVIATGGASGSNTIGNQVTISGGEISITNNTAMRALDEQFETLVRSLEVIRNHLEQDKPDISAVEGIYQSLKNTWVPGVITSVLGTVLSNTIGIGI
jgi:ribosomal protein S15P/S13E